MKQYRLTPQALWDVNSIKRYLGSRVGLHIASQFISKFKQSVQTLCQTPQIRHYRDDITPVNVRFWIFYNRYSIIYRENNPLEIIRVVDSAQDVANLLKTFS